MAFNREGCFEARKWLKSAARSELRWPSCPQMPCFDRRNLCFSLLMPKSRETGPITIRAETGFAQGRRRGLRRQQRRRPDPVWAAQARARRGALRRPCSQRRVLGVAGGAGGIRTFSPVGESSLGSGDLKCWPRCEMMQMGHGCPDKRTSAYPIVCLKQDFTDRPWTWT